MGEIITNVAQYIGTNDYFNNLSVELTGFVFDIILLSIIIPVIIKIYVHRSTIKQKMLISFYILQLCHKISDIFINILKIDDVPNYIHENKISDTTYSHVLYGNLENKIQIIKHNYGKYNEMTKSLTLANFDEIIENLKNSIIEIDRLSAVSVNFYSVFDDLFKLRAMTFVLKDIFIDFRKQLQAGEINTDGFQFRYTFSDFIKTNVVLSLDNIFLSRRKLVDRRLWWERNRLYCLLFPVWFPLYIAILPILILILICSKIYIEKFGKSKDGSNIKINLWPMKSIKK